MIRTKKNAIALTAFFIILVGIGEFTDWLPLGRIWKQSRQSTVQDCRVNILTTPDLQKIGKKITSIDRFADFKQVGRSAYFRVGNLSKKSTFYKLTEPEYKFEPISDPNSMQPFVLVEFSVDKGKLRININDKLASSLSLGSEKYTQENTLIKRINSDQSTFVVKLEDKNESVGYLADVKKPDLKYVDGLSNIVHCASDKTGLALIVSDDKDNLFRVEIDKQSVKTKPISTYHDNIDDIKYSAKAEALIIMDRSHSQIVILDAKTGAKRGALPLTKNAQVNVIAGTEGGLIDGTLIDLITGQVVEELPGFCKKSVFIVDFNNKRLYYSSCELGKESQPESHPTFISAYDLHEMKMETQVDLGEKSAGAEEKLKREDEVKSIFLDQMNRLIVMTVPI